MSSPLGSVFQWSNIEANKHNLWWRKRLLETGFKIVKKLMFKYVLVLPTFSEKYIKSSNQYAPVSVLSDSTPFKTGSPQETTGFHPVLFTYF